MDGDEAHWWMAYLLADWLLTYFCSCHHGDNALEEWFLLESGVDTMTTQLEITANDGGIRIASKWSLKALIFSFKIIPNVVLCINPHLPADGRKKRASPKKLSL